jgi:diguanylate cyclase (GGDEF)-like protein
MTDASPEKGNILLVDDLPDNLRLLNDLLVNLGYSVRSVTSGKMAICTVEAKPPDVILLDVKMPDLDGYQVCETLKAMADTKEIPIIFISAINDTFDKIRAFQLGAVDYITKPFQCEEVVARLETQLTIQRQKKILQAEINKRRETEEILYQSRALLSSILNTSLDGIAALQAIRESKTGEIKDFRCLVVNPVMAQAFKRDHRDLLGKPIVKHCLQRLDPNLFDRLVAVVETGEALEEDLYYELAESCWYHFVAVKLGDGFAITIRDITPRKRLELELQSANEKLYALAHRDSLTQIANRRCFDLALAREWRQQQSFSLLLLDVDYFKPYNDVYGHQQGDDCLTKIAQALQRVTRATDLLARYDGEAFALILPGSDQAKAIALARKIRDLIEQLQLPHPVSDVSDYVTVSIGLGCITPHGNIDPDYFLQRVDRALYQAKQQGRNRYMVAAIG